MAADPITAGFSFGEALTALITKAMPSDEQKLKAFEARFPDIYARVRLHILKQGYLYLKHHNGVSIDAYVNFVNGDLSDIDKANVESILKSELNKGK